MYDQDDIAPSAELSTIPVITSKDDLPWSRPQWVVRHFSNLINKPNKVDKENL